MKYRDSTSNLSIATKGVENGVANCSNSTFTERIRGAPIVMAHRGFKAVFPENTMLAFAAAIRAGAHCIETDIHLSRDGAAVLSHDATLKRCYGVDKRVIDLDVEELQTYLTIREPKQRMPTLAELLQLLSMPMNEEISVLLDIKTDNIAEDVMQSIANAIASVKGDASYWSRRIMLGIWNLDFVPLCQQYIPGFPMTFIGFNIDLAREFLKVPDASFNLFFPSIVGPKGANFVKEAHAANRNVHVWTINNGLLMRWAISMHVDGICTDEIEKCRRIVGDKKRTRHRIPGLSRLVRPIINTIGTYLTVIGFKIMVRVFTALGRGRHGTRHRR